MLEYYSAQLNFNSYILLLTLGLFFIGASDVWPDLASASGRLRRCHSKPELRPLTPQTRTLTERQTWTETFVTTPGLWHLRNVASLHIVPLRVFLTFRQRRMHDTLPGRDFPSDGQPHTWGGVFSSLKKLLNLFRIEPSFVYSRANKPPVHLPRPTREWIYGRGIYAPICVSSLKITG